MKKLTTIAAGLLLGLTSGLTHAYATLGNGGQIFATGGEVSVDVLPSSSGFDNIINLFWGYTDANHNITDVTYIGVDNHLATVNLGTFAAGTELVFGIVSPQGTFLMGDGSRNADGLAHGWVGWYPTVDGFSESWVVGFEDLLTGGDRDYNDAIFRVNQTAAVPEPGSLALLAAGIVGLVIARRKQA